MVNREVPQNIEAEQSVIGAMLLSKSAIVEAIESLVPENFYLDKHGNISRRNFFQIGKNCMIMIFQLILLHLLMS